MDTNVRCADFELARLARNHKYTFCTFSVLAHKSTSATLWLGYPVILIALSLNKVLSTSLTLSGLCY